MNLTPSKSQAADQRPISFILDADGSPVSETKLFIRPEDMSISYPSKVSVNQSIGGAWVDSFGEGLSTTTITGTTGWRTDPTGFDGIQRISSMKTEIYARWHYLRAQALARGDDPSKVKLRFVDTLNHYTRVIVPQVFEIKRSKSRPLLSMYRISFTALSTSPKPGSVPPTFDPSGMGGASLLTSLTGIAGAIAGLRNFINGSILAPVQGFMRMSSNVLSTITGYIDTGKQLTSGLIGIARDITQTGVTLFRTLASIANLPTAARVALMQIASAYSNAYCVLKNALTPLITYEDYRALHGASNCSSTAGGSPPSIYAGQNAFAAVVPQVATPVSILTPAVSSMRAINGSDPVFSPMPIDQMGNNLRNINSGLVLA